MALDCKEDGQNSALRLLVETMFDPCVVCSAVRNEQAEVSDFRLEYLNQQAGLEWGLPREQIVGKRLCELPLMWQTSELLAALRRVAETGAPIDERIAAAGEDAPSGTVHQRERVVQLRASTNGEHLVAVWHDVTATVLQSREDKREQRVLRLFTETIDDVFWAATPGIEESLYISPAYDRIWGRPRAELKTNPRAFVEAVHPEDRVHVLEHLDKLHAQGRSSSLQYRVVRPNGEVRWVHERGFLADAKPGEDPITVGVCSDITDRVLSEQSRIRTEALLRKAEALAHVGAWEWNICDDVILLSDEWLNIHGCTEHQVKRAELVMLAHPDDRQLLEEQHRAVIEGNYDSYSIDYRIVRPSDGQVRYVASRAKLFPEQHGCSLRMIGCDQDITERTAVEQELRASRDHLQRVYDAAGQGILSTRFPERILESANRRFEEMSGYRAEELVGKSTAVLYADPSKYETAGESMRRAISENRSRLTLEMMMRRKNGEVFPSQLTVSFSVERGVPIRAISVIENISERRRAEAEMSGVLMAAHAVLESQRFNVAAGRILNIAKQQTGARLGWIALRDEETGDRVTFWGHSELEGQHATSVAPDGLLYDVCQHDIACFENDIVNAAQVQILKDLGVRKNVLFAPASLAGHVMGVIALADSERDFEEHDMRLTRALAEVVALSLQRDRYLDRLLATEQLLTTTGRMAKVGGWELDCRTKRLHWSPITCEIHEVSQGSVPSLDEAISFYHPDDRQCLEMAIKNAITHATPYDLELNHPLIAQRKSRRSTRVDSSAIRTHRAGFERGHLACWGELGTNTGLG